MDPQRLLQPVDDREAVASLVPGPTAVTPAVRAIYAHAYPSADLDPRFVEEYRGAQDAVCRLVGAVPGEGDDKDDDDDDDDDDDADPAYNAVIQSGEAMVSLWGALKSVVAPGTRVLAVVTGLFGAGIADMARGLGAEVRTVEADGWDCTVDAALEARVAAEAAAFRPHLVTAVHCETPSGTLNPLEALGRAAREAGALFYVDFVSSGGAAPVRVREAGIDLGLLGTQKALSLPPDLGVTVVSRRAWEAVARVGYQGYDALLPFRRAHRTAYFPYTMNWAAVRALRYACEAVLARGLDAVCAEHAEVAAHCRRRLAEAGVRPYPREGAVPAPSVTAALVPDGWTWPQLRGALAARGVELGGNYGPLAGKVFRVGHMGSQCSRALVDRAADALAEALAEGPPPPPAQE